MPRPIGNPLRFCLLRARPARANAIQSLPTQPQAPNKAETASLTSGSTARFTVLRGPTAPGTKGTGWRGSGLLFTGTGTNHDGTGRPLYLPAPRHELVSAGRQRRRQKVFFSKSSP